MKSKILSASLCSSESIAHYRILRVEALNTPKRKRLRRSKHYQIKWSEYAVCI